MFADQLREISKNQDEIKIASFLEEIKGHQEEKLLMGCLTEAMNGRNMLGLCRGCLIPKTLLDEGFKVVVDGPGFACSWS